MRVVRLFLCVFISFLLSISLAAQQTATSSPQALQLLQRSLSALSSGQTLTDVTLTGTARRIAGSDDESGTVVLKATASGSSKIALSFSSGNRNEVRSTSNNSLTGSWSGPDGVPHPISYHNLMTDSGLFPDFTLANLIASQKTVATYVGQETRNGSTVIHISAYQQLPGITGDAALLPQHLSQIEIFLDPTTLLPASIAFNTHPDNNALLEIPIEVDFSDYRVANGIQVPFHVQKYLNNSLFLDLQFQSVAVNTGLTTGLFSL
jgi:hypothetical protein